MKKLEKTVEEEKIPETVRKILSRISQTIEEHKIPLNEIKTGSVQRILSSKVRNSGNFFNNDPDMLVYEETFRNYYKN